MLTSEGGRRCFVRTRRSKQKERLLRGQVKSIVYEGLKEDLAECPRPPQSIIIHRDGRAFECEWRGFQDAVGQLLRERLLPSAVVIGVVGDSQAQHRRTATCGGRAKGTV